MLNSVVDNKTRLEILRLAAEMDNPVGADTLARRLVERGIGITVDAVRYHLRVLDEQGFTTRLGTRGRMLTEEGWSELRRSLVDTRMRYALARTETLAQQVRLDAESCGGQVVAALTIFPANQLSSVLAHCAGACRAGLCVSDRIGLVNGGDRMGGVLVPPDSMGLITLSTATVDGYLLSHGLLFRPTFGGIVEMAGRHPYRFVDVVDFGRGSRDPVEILVRPGSTRVRSAAERGQGLILADVREVVGVAREKAVKLLEEMRCCGLGGVLEVGQVGQPILGVPVQQHTFGIALVAGINPTVAAYEAGVLAEFHCSESMVDYSSLRPVDELLPEAGAAHPPTAGVLMSSGHSGLAAQRP